MRCARVWPAVLLMVVAVASQEQGRRNRGEGLYRCVSSNTAGSGNIWVTMRALGFVWDDNPEQGGRPLVRGFPEVRAEVGVLNVASVFAETRPISYPWNGKLQFGGVSGGVKATLPNNKDLRFHGVGLEAKASYSDLEGFNSIAGYRHGGTGFSPEGWMVEGTTLQFKLLYDRDYIARRSKLPFKLFANGGIRIPMDAHYRIYSQYLLDVGFAYVGNSADVFVEYSFEGFVNSSAKPKRFTEAWEGWQRKDTEGLDYKTWEVAFLENPMYLTIGGRVRYSNGIVLFGCVPLLLSMNRGSAMTDEDRTALDRHHQKFYREWHDAGITDPFDPWFAKWKVVGQISFPIRYRQTGAEMRRSFLLMKNRRRGKKIDIDERLKTLEEEQEPSNEKEPETKESEEDDDAKRLERIRHRRREIQETD